MRKKVIVLISVILMVAVGYIVLSQKQEDIIEESQQKPLHQFNTYRDVGLGIEFEYPKAWGDVMERDDEHTISYDINGRPDKRVREYSFHFTNRKLGKKVTYLVLSNYNVGLLWLPSEDDTTWSHHESHTVNQNTFCEQLDNYPADYNITQDNLGIQSCIRRDHYKGGGQIRYPYTEAQWSWRWNPGATIDGSTQTYERYIIFREIDDKRFSGVLGSIESEPDSFLSEEDKEQLKKSVLSLVIQ